MLYWRFQPVLVPGDRAENQSYKGSDPKEQIGGLQKLLNIIDTKKVGNRLQRDRNGGGSGGRQVNHC